MREIDIPGYGVKSFPVDMDDDEIRGIIKRKFPAEQEENTGILKSIAESAGTQFVLGAGDQFTNVARNISNFITPESMNSPLLKSGEGTAYDVGSIAGEIGAFLPAAGAAGLGLKAAESLPVIGGFAAKLGGKIAPGVFGTQLSAAAPSALSEALGGGAGVARRALGSGIYGASQSPDDRMLGAGEMGAASLASDALMGGLSKFMPGSLLSGSAFPNEAIQQNLRAAKGTETGLGSVIGNRIMQRTEENILPSIPFSGAAEGQASTSRFIKNKGQELLDQYSHGIEKKDINNAISEELKSAYSTQKQMKNDLYNAPNKMADDLGLKVESKNLSETAAKYKSSIEKSDIFLFNDELKGLLSKATDLQKGVEGGSGLSLKQAGILKGQLNSLSNKFKASNNPSDHNKSNVLSKFAKSLTKDIDDNLSKWSSDGHPDIKLGYQAANKNYASNYSEFLDKDIYNFLGDKKDSSKIVSDFVKRGIDNDNPYLVDKLMSKLSDRGQDLVKYSYLSKALDSNKNINPQKMKSLLGGSNLGADQKQALFNKPGEAAILDDFAKLTSMNAKGLNNMLNLETGQKAMDILSPYALGTAATALGGYFGGGVEGAMGGAAAGLGASKGLSSLLRNQKVRDSVAKSIMKNRDKKDKNVIGDVGKYIRQILTSGAGSAVRGGGYGQQ